MISRQYQINQNKISVYKIYSGSKASTRIDTHDDSKPMWCSPNGLQNKFNTELNQLPLPVFRSIEPNGSKQKSSSTSSSQLHHHHQRTPKQYITPEHNEMIKYVQQSWKGVERDYKKSVNKYINNLDLNGSSDHLSASLHLKQKSQAKKKTATTSTPLLLSGSYHHTSGTNDSSSARKDSFQPFDLETFWGNRILKRLTEEL